MWNPFLGRTMTFGEHGTSEAFVAKWQYRKNQSRHQESSSYLCFWFSFHIKFHTNLVSVYNLTWARCMFSYKLLLVAIWEDILLALTAAFFLLIKYFYIFNLYPNLPLQISLFFLHQIVLLSLWFVFHLASLTFGECSSSSCHK